MVSEFLNLATYTWKPASPPANRCGKLASPLAQAWVCEQALEAISIRMDFAGGVVVSMNNYYQYCNCYKYYSYCYYYSIITSVFINSIAVVIVIVSQGCQAAGPCAFGYWV